MIAFEPVAIAWLNATDLGAHAASDVPPSLDGPFIRVTLLDGRGDERTPTITHGRGFLQLDCYAGSGGGQAEAHDIARAVMARLQEMPRGTHAEAVVSAVNAIAYNRLPDTEMKPARERYVVTAIVHAHERTT